MASFLASKQADKKKANHINTLTYLRVCSCLLVCQKMTRGLFAISLCQMYPELELMFSAVLLCLCSVVANISAPSGYAMPIAWSAIKFASAYGGQSSHSGPFGFATSSRL